MNEQKKLIGILLTNNLETVDVLIVLELSLLNNELKFSELFITNVLVVL